MRLSMHVVAVREKRLRLKLSSTFCRTNQEEALHLMSSHALCSLPLSEKSSASNAKVDNIVSRNEKKRDIMPDKGLVDM